MKGDQPMSWNSSGDGSKAARKRVRHSKLTEKARLRSEVPTSRSSCQELDEPDGSCNGVDQVVASQEQASPEEAEDASPTKKKKDKKDKNHTAAAGKDSSSKKLEKEKKDKKEDPASANSEDMAAAEAEDAASKKPKNDKKDKKEKPLSEDQAAEQNQVPDSKTSAPIATVKEKDTSLIWTAEDIEAPRRSLQGCETMHVTKIERTVLAASVELAARKLATMISNIASVKSGGDMCQESLSRFEETVFNSLQCVDGNQSIFDFMANHESLALFVLVLETTYDEKYKSIGLGSMHRLTMEGSMQYMRFDNERAFARLEELYESLRDLKAKPDADTLRSVASDGKVEITHSLLSHDVMGRIFQEEAERMLTHWDDVNEGRTSADYRQNLLTAACLGGCKDIVKLFLDQPCGRVFLKCFDDLGATILDDLVLRCDLDMVRFVLDYPGDKAWIHSEIACSLTVLQQAFAKHVLEGSCDLEMLELLLEQYHCETLDPNNISWTMWKPIVGAEAHKRDIARSNELQAKGGDGRVKLMLRWAIYNATSTRVSGLKSGLPKELHSEEKAALEKILRQDGAESLQILQGLFASSQDVVGAQTMKLFPRMPRVSLHLEIDDADEVMQQCKLPMKRDWYDFEGRNLRWPWIWGAYNAPGYFYLSRVCGLCCLEAAQGLAEAPLTAAVLNSSFAAAIVESLWSRALVWYSCDLAVELTLLITIIATSQSLREGADQRPTLLACVLATVLVVKLLLDEVSQWCSEVVEHYLFWGTLRHCITNMNFLDMGALVVEVSGVIQLCNARATDVTSLSASTILALWVLVRWTKVVTLLRGTSIFGLAYMPILNTLRAAAPMLCFTAGALAALTHAVYIIAPRNDAPSAFYSSLLLTFRLGILGDFDRFEIEGTDPTLVEASQATPLTLEPSDPEPTRKFMQMHVWFFASAIMLQVLMLQLFVGVLGAKYDYHEDSAVALFVKERARLLCRLHVRMWYRFPLNRSIGKAATKQLGIYDKVIDENTEATSVRAAIRNNVCASHDKIVNIVTSRISKVESRMEAMESQMEIMEANMNSMLQGQQDILKALGRGTDGMFS